MLVNQQEDFLQQSSFDEADRFSPLEKTYWMLRVLLAYYHHCQTALAEGTALEVLRALPEVEQIARVKEVAPEKVIPLLQQLDERLRGGAVKEGSVHES